MALICTWLACGLATACRMPSTTLFASTVSSPPSALARQVAVLAEVADGVHLSDAMVDLVRATTGPSGITLVSDAMAATGMPDGDYVLGALPVTVTGGVAQMTSSTAAKAAGFGDRGTIAVGKRADLLLCDDTPARNPAPRDGRAPTPPTVITAGKRKER